MRAWFSLLLLAITGNDKEINDVTNFNLKFGLPCRFHSPAKLSKREMIDRLKFIDEELNELIEATGVRRKINGHYAVCSTKPQDLAAQADALVDLVYVIKGTAIRLGLPWEELWDDVQRANMAKVEGTIVGYKSGAIKPEGWVPPRTEEILKRWGYTTDPEDRT